MDRWFAVARSEELPRRHVFQTQLLGRELALWRDDTGAVNAWANRCPHRGVRLSIGINTGGELRCRYHGWRFEAGTGQCTYIPAHPRQKPASTLRAAVHRATEREGYVWVDLGRAPEEPHLGVEASAATTLRSIFVEAPAAAVAQGLLCGYRLDEKTLGSVTARDEFTLIAAPAAGAAGTPGAVATPAVAVPAGGAGTAPGAAANPGSVTVPAEAWVTFLLQPVTASQTVIHGMVREVSGAARMATLRFHNTQLTRIRDALERVNPSA